MMVSLKCIYSYSQNKKVFKTETLHERVEI